MPGSPQFRAASKADCLAIARLYSIASDGIADYIWSKHAAPGEDPLLTGQRRYEREGTDFSYQNCTVVEDDGEILGMLVAFPMHIDPAYVEEDPVLRPYAILEEDDSYYICGVALVPGHRGLGLGSMLMARAEQDARRLGYTKLSLIVFARNQRAKALYERLGYREKIREPIVPHPLIHYTGDALLMVKQL